VRKVFADRICDTVRNRCKKPQAVQAEQTKRVKEYVYSIMAMKTKDLHTNVTAKYPPRRAKPCICDRYFNDRLEGRDKENTVESVVVVLYDLLVMEMR